MPENKFYLDFRKIEREHFKPDLVLWVEFVDRNRVVFKNISFKYTLAQMYFERGPVICSLKHVWDTYHNMLNNQFKGKWIQARIYHRDSKDPKDYYVEYRCTGEVTFRRHGVEIPNLWLDFDGDKCKRYEYEQEMLMREKIKELKQIYGSHK
mgnify:FL=1